MCWVERQGGRDREPDALSFSEGRQGASGLSALCQGHEPDLAAWAAVLNQRPFSRVPRISSLALHRTVKRKSCY